MENIPRVGVGLLVKRDGMVLLGLRKNSHGDGTWSPPGGHLEFMETIEECALREAMEEVGVIVKNIIPPIFTEEFYPEHNKHYINLMIMADWAGNEPEVKEPDKFERWEWFAWDNLPQPLFQPLQNHVDQGFNPFK